MDLVGDGLHVDADENVGVGRAVAEWIALAAMTSTTRY
jgi:hypothetical protein